MNWLGELFFGSGIVHILFTLAAVVAVGVILAKVRIGGVSLGMTWVLFAGIAASHFGMIVPPAVLQFVKEFGLILFVYMIGLQVGPGFFASFKRGGVRLNLLAAAVVALGVLAAWGLHRASGTPLTTMVGILSGAVTNTPGLGAAQEAYAQTTGAAESTIALGYAVAYPMGVIGVILVMVLLKRLIAPQVEGMQPKDPGPTIACTSVELLNPKLSGLSIVAIRRKIDRPFVISRVMDREGRVEAGYADTVLHRGDRVFLVTAPEDLEAVAACMGQRIDLSREAWSTDGKLLSRRIVITRTKINGRYLGDLKLRSAFGVNVTRVNRSGVELTAQPDLQLQLGDRLTVVGEETALKEVSHLLGDSVRRLREPNLIPIFLGIMLGVALGAIPLRFGGIPQPIRLGLAGGPLIVAILIGRFGPAMKLVTYTTVSANWMLREVGLALFLAGVGLGAGSDFVHTVVYGGGWRWIGYGLVITCVPISIIAFVARKWLKFGYYPLIGLLAGSMTNPPALAYASAIAPEKDNPAVVYSTVFPLVMFLRVLTAQLLILSVL